MLPEYWKRGGVLWESSVSDGVSSGFLKQREDQSQIKSSTIIVSIMKGFFQGLSKNEKGQRRLIWFGDEKAWSFYGQMIESKVIWFRSDTCRVVEGSSVQFWYMQRAMVRD